MRARYAVSFGRGAQRHEFRDRSARAGLSVRADRPGLLLLADPDTPVVAGAKGLAVGQPFDSAGRSLEDLGELGEPAEAASKYWGSFALFAEAPPSVYRDPSGGLAVYAVGCDQGTVLVSDAEIAIRLGLLEHSEIDVDFAIHWLQFPYLRSARTGLASAVEILPGTCRRARHDVWVDELAWNPWDHAGGGQQPAPGEAAQALRELALATVAVQLATEPVLLQLSGGLDSSIIAACLAEAAIPFTAVNFATRSADGDERRYARIVAGGFGAALFEIHEDDLKWRLDPPAERKFRPGSNPVLLPLDGAIEQHRRTLGPAVLVDGGGGDNLFGYLTSAAPVVDALISAGPAVAWRTADDVAGRAECSWWRVVGQAARRLVPERRPPWREDHALLNREALLSRPDPHPWLQAPAFSLPGKREHVASLVEIQHFLDRRLAARGAILHPLMARPLLELCLAVASWEWVRGGIDRAVAREAFRALLPPRIIERRGKGSLQGLFQRSFARLRTELRDLLLSGELRRLGIADMAAIERIFASQSVADETQTRLSEMAALELWLQSWRR